MTLQPLTDQDIHNIHPKRLVDLAERGIIKIMVNKQTPIPQTIEDTPEYKKHADLKGQKISIGDASRKYNVPHRTISRWKDRNIIPVLGTGKNRRIFLDESYVAYCAEIYKSRPGAGKWLFDENGLPYVPETR